MLEAGVEARGGLEKIVYVTFLAHGRHGGRDRTRGTGVERERVHVSGRTEMEGMQGDWGPKLDVGRKGPSFRSVPGLNI